jgi:hypothetical protein
MSLILSNTGIRVTESRRDQQFRALCRTPSGDTGNSDTQDELDTAGRPMEKPFGFMYNLFFWAVYLGAQDGTPEPVSSPVVPFRWNQIPSQVQNRLEALALGSLLKTDSEDETKKRAKELLSKSEEEMSEVLRVRLEELAERGLHLMENEVEFERPDAYATVENIVETILSTVG